MTHKNIYDIITAIAKRRGFYWPSFEIYGGLSGFVTYGDLGTKLKRNIEETWRDFFIRRQGFLELEAPIINPLKVFDASGHLDNFKEYMVECNLCKQNFRADHLIEEKTNLENVEAMGIEAIRHHLKENKIKCPNCSGQLKDPVLFLTMFQTEIGATGGDLGFARPETAQGMFINFKRGFQQAREKLPFALAQKGKVLRNEISPRRGLIRLREFTIIELELFFDPNKPICEWLKDVSDETINLITEDMQLKEEKKPLETTIGKAVEARHIKTEWQAYFIGLSKSFITYLGVPEKKQRFRAHLPAERAHYSIQTFDHEVKLDSWGWIEVAGHAYRTDYDLRAHSKGAGIDLKILGKNGTRFIPHVVEPSYGLDRLLYVSLESNYKRKNKRNIFNFPRALSPYQISVFPLVSKDDLPEKSKEIYHMVQDAGFNVFHDVSGSVGRRYARSDEAGTPIAITIDYDTMEKKTVTVRDRDSWKQVRLLIAELVDKMRKYFNDKIDFEEIGEPV